MDKKSKAYLTAALISLAIALIVFYAGIMANAAGSSVTVTYTRIGDVYTLVTYTWTADDSNGSVPATASKSLAGYIVKVVTDPGATAPTDDYDITLTDSDGVDVMGGALADRDTANTEQAVPKIGAAYGGSFFTGALTLNISNNSVNSATGEVKVYISR